MVHPDQKIARRHSQPVITVGTLAIDLEAKRVTIGSRSVRLTGSEYQMLELLAQRKGTCVTRGAFMDHLYGGTNPPKQKILDIFMCKLRSKLSVADGVDKLIETIWGRGYLLNDRASVVAASSRAHGSAVGLSRSGRHRQADI